MIVHKDSKELTMLQASWERHLLKDISKLTTRKSHLPYQTLLNLHLTVKSSLPVSDWAHRSRVSVSLRLQKRRIWMNQHAGLPETLLAAGRTFVMGIVLGLAGLVMHPYRGEERGGGAGRGHS